MGKMLRSHAHTQAGVIPPEDVKKETCEVMDEKIRVLSAFV